MGAEGRFAAAYPHWRVEQRAEILAHIEMAVRRRAFAGAGIEGADQFLAHKTVGAHPAVLLERGNRPRRIRPHIAVDFAGLISKPAE